MGQELLTEYKPMSYMWSNTGNETLFTLDVRSVISVAIYLTRSDVFI